MPECSPEQRFQFFDVPGEVPVVQGRPQGWAQSLAAPAQGNLNSIGKRTPAKATQGAGPQGLHRRSLGPSRSRVDVYDRWQVERAQHIGREIGFAPRHVLEQKHVRVVSTEEVHVAADLTGIEASADVIEPPPPIRGKSIGYGVDRFHERQRFVPVDDRVEVVGKGTVDRMAQDNDDLAVGVDRVNALAGLREIEIRDAHLARFGGWRSFLEKRIVRLGGPKPRATSILLTDAVAGSNFRPGEVEGLLRLRNANLGMLLQVGIERSRTGLRGTYDQKIWRSETHIDESSLKLPGAGGHQHAIDPEAFVVRPGSITFDRFGAVDQVVDVARSRGHGRWP